jgi:hypothetical protein
VTTFPTGKPHISYSEIKTWKECPWKHKLVYIDKIDLFKPNPNVSFGTIVHQECEDYLKSKKFDRDRLATSLEKTWTQHSFPDQGKWLREANGLLDEIPAFLDATFPEWSCVAAEHALYENIEGHDIKFKGFVDGMIRAKSKRGNDCLWVLDWKTTSSGGWRSEKKQDFLIQSQVALYKSFCSQKFNINPKDIKCGFVLLKRGSKPGKSCELLEISAGPVMLEKANKLVTSMIKGVKSGLFVKNRTSCTYCDFKSTDHCPGSSDFKPFTNS